MKHLWLILSSLPALFFACSIGDIAGSKGGSETTNGVYACVLNPDGKPAAGSAVRLRKSDYVSQPSMLAKKTIDRKELITDSTGSFLITGIDPGEYYIEVNDTATRSGAVLFSFTIGNNKDTLDLGSDSLRPYAVLRGQIDTDSTESNRFFVQVKGLERLAEVDTNGSFIINDLPEGFLDVVISGGSTSGTEKELKNVKTASDDTVTVRISGSSVYWEYIYLNTASASLSGSAITGFPVLIRLKSSSFNFEEADPEGDDILFTKADGTALPFEIEQWDNLTEDAVIWVKLDTISDNSTDYFIVMKWGGTEENRSNGAAVFDTANGFAGVWHLNENPSSGTGSLKNRTGNRYHGTAGLSMTSNNSVEAVIGRGLWFNGITDTVNAGVLNLEENYTLSCWIKAEKSPWSNWRLIIKETSYTLWYDTVFNGFRSEHFVDTFTWHGIYQDCDNSNPYPVTLDTWTYLASTYDGNRIHLYINGEIVDSTRNISMNPHSNTDNPLLFGGRLYKGEISEFFKGVMDEVRIENKARSAEWIRLCYLSQQPGSKIVRFRNK